MTEAMPKNSPRLVLLLLIAGACGSSSDTKNKDEVTSTGQGGSAEVTAAQPADSRDLTAKSSNRDCKQACEHLLALTMAELEQVLAAPEMKPEIATKLRAQAAATKDTDLATCSLQCGDGKLDATCTLNAASLTDISSCTTRGKATAEQSAAGLTKALAKCEDIKVGAQEGECSTLARQVLELVAALGTTKGAHMNDEIDACTELILDLDETRCADDASFKQAIQGFTMAILAQ